MSNRWYSRVNNSPEYRFPADNHGVARKKKSFLEPVCIFVWPLFLALYCYFIPKSIRFENGQNSIQTANAGLVMYDRYFNHEDGVPTNIDN